MASALPGGAKVLTEQRLRRRSGDLRLASRHAAGAGKGQATYQ
jgi:hypothetical protein